MPVKKVDNLKDKNNRESGQAMQRELGINNLTTNEWERAGFEGSTGKSKSEIRDIILNSRKR